MQMRSRAYLQVISRLRAFRAFLWRSDDATTEEAAPLLVFTAIVLALLLVILEVDLHSFELQSLGLLGGSGIDPVFMSP